MKKWMTGCLIVALASLAGEGMAQRPGRGPAAGRGPDQTAIMQEAGLSEAQIEQISQIRDEVRREVIGLRAEIQTARLDFRREMDAETPDEATVMSALERVHAAQLQIRKAQVRGLLRARAIAGAEAWAQIRQDTENWFEERMERRRDETGPDERRGGRRGDDRGPPPWAGR